MLQYPLDMGGNKKQSNKHGFSLVEVIIVISIIGILAAIITVTFDNVRKATRTSERETDIEMLANALEKYYDENGDYPAPTSLVNNNGTISGGYITHEVLKDIPAEALVAPLAPADTTNSIKLITDYSYSSMTVDSYGYSVAFSANPDYCTNDSMSCSNYVLFYKDEVNKVLKAKCSQHGKTAGMPCGQGFAVAPSCPAGQVGSPPNCAMPAFYKPSAPLTPSASATTSAANFSWSAVATATGYKVEYRLNGGAWTLLTNNQTTTTASVSANQAVLVEVRVYAKYNNNQSVPSGIASARIVIAAPALTLSRITGYRAYLTWPANSVATSYQVTVGSNTYTTTANSYNFLGTYNTNYNVTVKTISGSYSSANSNTVTVQTPRESISVTGTNFYFTKAATFSPTNPVNEMNNTRESSIVSPDGRYVLIWRSNGDLNLMDLNANTYIALAGTNNSAYSLIFQGDGNLVIYNGGTPVKHINVSGSTSSTWTLAVQNDGNVVMYEGSTPRWARFGNPQTSGPGLTFLVNP